MVDEKRTTARCTPACQSSLRYRRWPFHSVMSALPKNASLEDIESELLFTDLMLQSLDSEAEDYAVRKLELEALQEEYESMRDAIDHPDDHPPHTPDLHHVTSNLTASGSSRELNLATRPSPAATPPPTSTLSHGSSYYQDARLTNNGSLSTGFSDSNYAESPYSTAPRKRQREGPDVQPPHGFQSSHKSRRTSDSPCASTASTSASVDSLEQEEKAFTQRYGLNLSGAASRSALRRKLEEEQRQRELHYKRVKEDEEFARQLQAQSMPPSSSRYTTQSYFNPNGTVQRPLRPSVNLVPSPFTPNLHPSQSVKTEPKSFGSKPTRYTEALDRLQSRHITKAESAEIYPSLSSWRPNSVPMAQHKSGTDEDDDLQEITSAEFAGLARTGKSPYSTTQSPKTLLSNSPTTGGPHNLAPNPYNDWSNGHRNAHGVGGMGGNPVYDNPTLISPTYQPYGYPPYSQNQVGGVHAAAPSWMASAMNGMSHVTSGVSDLLGQVQSLVGGSWPASGTDLNNFVDSDEYSDDIGTFPSLHSNLHAHGLDYLLNDPTRTKEDIEALLSNIRPDEELPPEMRLDTPDAMKRPLMEHQKLGLTWLKAQEEGSHKGGILADDVSFS